ncbi:glycosyltransferase family 2 protein [Kiloniella sp.]|uniref:glycosyltransferase family 2 protein n=1 Tax=Kiloniella sp. TaxID=1938587 RepID=UPI003B01FC94
MLDSDTKVIAPTVSIGVVVYNGEASLAEALESLLAQTFTDFEIIVSDNASSDRTANICKAYCERDSRIRYIRQIENLGATRNFQFVLERARGRYFMWAAADDIRSPDFLKDNVQFLEEHTDYVASTSPNCYKGQEHLNHEWVYFSLEEESAEERFLQFFQHCWQSHAIFYSLMRSEIAKNCSEVAESFIAADWAFNLYLLSHGKIYRTHKGLTVLGVNGVSSQPRAYQKFRNYYIELFIPFYRLGGYTLQYSKGFSAKTRITLLLILFKLNLRAVMDQCHANLYRFYRKCRTVKHQSINSE